MNFLEAAQKLISIESSPDIGTSDAVKYLAHLAKKETNFEVEILPSPHFGEDHCNLLIKLKAPEKTNKPGLLLLSHLDTTDPGSYGQWTKTHGNPFRASIYGDEMFGLGVTNKLDFLSKLKALMSVDVKNLKKDIYLLGTHGQELGLLGVREFLTDNKISFDQALVGHPTNLNLIHQGLGVSVVEIDVPFSKEELAFQETHNLADNSFTQSKVFRGKGAHSANPQQGENAVEKMFEFLSHMPSVVTMGMNGGIMNNTVPEYATLEFVMSGSVSNNIADKLLSIYGEVKKLRNHFKEHPMEGFESKYSLLNIGMVRSSNFGITMTGNCRLLPSVREKEYRHWLTSLKQFCESKGSKFQLKRHIPSFHQDQNSNWLLEMKEVLKELPISSKNDGNGASSVCTEANLIGKRGVDCLLFGAGVGPGNSHQPNESVSISDLKQSTAFYTKTLKRMCL